MTIEIHEAAATDLPPLVEFGKLLHDLDMQLAFDDFGSGHARLLELTETSPDYVKFDIALIRGIDHASPRVNKRWAFWCGWYANSASPRWAKKSRRPKKRPRASNWASIWRKDSTSAAPLPSRSHLLRRQTKRVAAKRCDSPDMARLSSLTIP